ncbi:hypothetical protein GW915_09370 [bacterium]|nr:hypothetical protein [bacterium]
MKALQRGVLVLVLTLLAFAPKQASAMSRTSKLFILTSTYGVMAGTLTGIASLAFYSQPRAHLRNVAQGASIGLYVGILMGAYMVYFVSDGKEKSRESTPEGDPDNPLDLPDGGAKGQGSLIDPLELPTFQPLLAYDPQTQTGSLGFQYRF